MRKNEFPLSRVAEIKVSYQPYVAASERPKISDVDDAYKVLMHHWDLGLIELQEQFKIILLNRSNRVIGICDISKGGVAGTIVDPKLIFGIAVKSCASSIILAHNHPSGNLTHSKSDLAITKQLIEGGKLLDIQVYDHLIITAYGFLSMAREELI